MNNPNISINPELIISGKAAIMTSDGYTISAGTMNEADGYSVYVFNKDGRTVKRELCPNIEALTDRIEDAIAQFSAIKRPKYTTDK